MDRGAWNLVHPSKIPGREAAGKACKHRSGMQGCVTGGGHKRVGAGADKSLDLCGRGRGATFGEVGTREFQSLDRRSGDLRASE